MVKSASLEDLVGDSRSRAARSGGLGVWYQTKTATPIKGEETDFVATVPVPSSAVLPAKGSLFPHMAKLVYSMPTDSLKDLIEDKKGFPVRHGLLRQHPRVRMLTTHRDAHIYIFPHWVMQFVKENERLETIGEDVVGWWAKASWQKGLSAKLGLDKVLRRAGGDHSDGHVSPGGGNTPPTQKLGVDSRATDAPTTVVTIKNLNGDDSQSDHSDNPSSPDNDPDNEPAIPPMVAYIHPSTPDAPLIRRADTAQLLLQISLQLAKLPSIEEVGSPEAASPFAHARKVAYPEGVKPRTTITKADSLVADNVTVQEKTSIKESVVGANCQIGEGAKLSQCLLMDGVVVGKNCKLTRCIVGKRAEIGDGCVLTECEVQENLLVEAKSEFLLPFINSSFVLPFSPFLQIDGTVWIPLLAPRVILTTYAVPQPRQRMKSSCPLPVWRRRSKNWTRSRIVMGWMMRLWKTTGSSTQLGFVIYKNWALSALK
jgi:translation initiation factor eIF-2B subunit gamma